MDHFLVSVHDHRQGHFLDSRVRNMPTTGGNLQMETSFSVGPALTPLLGDTDERWGTKSLMKPQGY
jgi:hypothetical protein